MRRIVWTTLLAVVSSALVASAHAGDYSYRTSITPRSMTQGQQPLPPYEAPSFKYQAPDFSYHAPDQSYHKPKFGYHPPKFGYQTIR